MRMSCENFTRIQVDRRNAKQGQFFFANFIINNGEIRKSPVFIAGCDNDKEDIIICSCTSQPKKTEFDIKVTLKMETYVRTNKIYTVHRNDLLFKIPQLPTAEELADIMQSIKKAFNI